MATLTEWLGLNIPDTAEKGFIVSTTLEPNFQKLDQFAERIDTEMKTKTETGYTNGGPLLGKTELVSGYQYYLTDGSWYKLKSNTTSPYTHDSTDTPNLTYLEIINYKSNKDLIEGLESNKLDKGNVSIGYNTAEKIENKIKSLETNETVLFDGSSTTKGVVTLSGNWDNYKEILFVSRKSDGTNMRHEKAYTEYVNATDNTATNSVDEYSYYVVGDFFSSCCFRDTNRNELYITEIVGTELLKVVGIDYIGE